MSATITSNAGGIKRSGVTVENEPIIKSDGDGEVMQWIPSSGTVADGITIDEPGAGNPLRVGVGTISPEAALDVNSVVAGSAGTVYGAIIRGTEATSANLAASDGIGLKFEIPFEGADTNIGASIEAIKASSTDNDSSTNLLFKTSANNETLATALTIDSAGDVTLSGDNSSTPLTVNGGTAAIASIQLNGGTSATDNASIQSKYNLALKCNSTGAIAGRSISFLNGTTEYLKIDSAGAVTIPGTVTIGSLDIGHGLGGDTSSVAVGDNALDSSLSTSQFNTAIGGNALTAVNHADADYNTAVGYNSGSSITTGALNTSVGAFCLDATDDGDYNTGMGVNALGANCGDHNTAVGNQALVYFTGSNATAVGSGAADVATSANYITAVGRDALGALTTGASNTAVGHSAGGALVDQDFNTFVGYITGGLTIGTSNTFIGAQAGYFAGNVDHCVAIGRDALIGVGGVTNATCAYNDDPTVTHDADANIIAGARVTGTGIPAGAYIVSLNSSTSFELSTATTGGSNGGGDGTLTFHRTSGDYNIAIGSYALDATTTAAGNVAIGYKAGTAIVDGGYNICVGVEAGLALTDNTYNIAIGVAALDAANTGEHHNIAIGTNALGAETSGADGCVAIGHNALLSQNRDGSKNTAIGYLALNALGGSVTYGGIRNTAVGYLAGGSGAFGGAGDGNGDDNTLVGYGAGYAITTGADNLSAGSQAGNNLTTGSSNVLLGKNAGAAMTTGTYNVAIGTFALQALTTNSHNNVAIGTNALTSQATEQATDVNCIAIGRNALYTQNDADAINLAIGKDAGVTISSGTQNVLIGHEAGSAIADDDANTALGYNALAGATAGAYNTAIGAYTLDAALTGSYNVAVGGTALGAASGDMGENTAVGVGALLNLNHASADGNIAIGYDAGRNYETTAGSAPTPDGAMTQALNSIYIGKSSCGIHATTADNEIVIGYNAVGNGTDSVTLGNAMTAALHCADTSIAALSDRRVKRDINDNAVGLDFIEKLATVNYKKLNPADWPTDIGLGAYREQTYTDQLVTPAVEAAEAVYEDVIVQEARDAVAEETREEVHAAVEEVTEEVTIPAVAEVTEERVTQEAREEIKSTRHKHSEVEVTETVTGEEIVEVDGKWVKRATSEEVTRIERTPLYEDCDLYNEDGSICTHCVTPAVEAKDAVVDEDGNEIEPAVEAVAEVRANDVHRVPVMEEYVSQTAQEEVTETVVVQAAEAERTETRVVVEAKDEWTETHITRPAEAAQEEVTERRLVSAAVEAKDAVYETVTVPADARPDDDDTVRLGLIAQDVQTAMTEAGVEFDIVNESPNGKLSLKYGNLVMPLIKAVQELSARVKTLEG